MHNANYLENLLRQPSGVYIFQQGCEGDPDFCKAVFPTVAEYVRRERESGEASSATVAALGKTQKIGFARYAFQLRRFGMYDLAKRIEPEFDDSEQYLIQHPWIAPEPGIIEMHMFKDLLRMLVKFREEKYCYANIRLEPLKNSKHGKSTARAFDKASKLQVKVQINNCTFTTTTTQTFQDNHFKQLIIELKQFVWFIVAYYTKQMPQLLDVLHSSDELRIQKILEQESGP